MTSTFAAVPAMQCFSPCRTFTNAVEALQYAERAAKTFKIAYAVWERFPRLRKMKTFPANQGDTETTQP